MQLPSEPSRDFPYHVEEKVGEGSMGVVYRARETNLDRPTAIKVLRSDVLDELAEDGARELSRRFLQEARASAKVNHTGVVTVHRLGSVRGQSFIAMEWLEGEDLRGRIDREAPVPIEAARDIVENLLETLQAAHSRDIVHRDVKPSNVMLEAGGRVVLTDFGIAQVRNSELVQTKAGSILGTPVYASPEQLLDDSVDNRADLFAVGVVLFEMLTGELPHDGDTVASLVAKRLEEDPPKPSAINPGVPEDVDAVVYRAIQRKPEHRFDSAAAMLGALETGVVPESDADSGRALRETAQFDAPERVDTTPEGPPIVVVEGGAPETVVFRTARNWPADPIGKRPTDELLDKLLETPLHAEPFAGALQLGETLLLIYQGLVFAAIDLETDEVGDAVVERIPDRAPATLLPVPDRFKPEIVPHLASLLYDPDRLHEDLDSTYTDLPGLVDRLCDKGFDGVVRLEAASELGFIVIEHGERLVDIFSTGWTPDPTERHWREWVEDRSVVAHVERRRTSLPSVTYRRELRDLSLDVTPASDGTEVDADTDDSKTNMRHSTWIVRPRESGGSTEGRDSTIWRDLYGSDPNYKLLNWMLEELPEYLAERGRFDRWKYLSTWIEQISDARLYTELPRPNQRVADFFDLVTFNPEGKVLHVVRRGERVGPNELETFASDVARAKQSRMDRGDIGGAILLASEFTEGIRKTYRETIGGDGESWFLNLQNSMTGYEGFVRIASRRGFHLMLVSETDDGFKPTLPPKE